MDVPHFCWLSYKEENAWKVDWCCCAVNGVKRTKIRNPRVYIYRAISVMLTSLCVSFWQPLGAFVASFFPNLTQFEVLELSFQTLSTGRRSCTMSCCWGGWVFGWGGGVWRNGTRESAGLWTCGACPFLLAVPLSWVCIVRAGCLLGTAPAGLRWPGPHGAANTTTNTLHGSRHERSWVFKALALSGNSWLGRHGGGWLLLLSLLLLFLLFVV